MADIHIDRRFNGPPAVVNGGFACATVAAALGAGSAEVTLRLPVPVATNLSLERDGERATLTNAAGDVLAVGIPGAVDVVLPEPVALSTAQAAMENSPTHANANDAFPCFVCNPRRDDGFHVVPGPVPARSLVAAVWRPATELAADDGRMPDPFAWAVLDCTGSIGAMFAHDIPSGVVLGRMTAEVLAPIRAGESIVAVGWALPAAGRKLPAGAALFRETGELVAHAKLIGFAA